MRLMGSVSLALGVTKSPSNNERLVSVCRSWRRSAFVKTGSFFVMVGGPKDLRRPIMMAKMN